MLSTVSLPPSGKWYEQTVCFNLRDVADIQNVTQPQIDVMKIIYICLVLSASTELFALATQDRFVSCLLQRDVDPGSEAVLEWFTFLPPEVCWSDEALAAEDEDDVEDPAAEFEHPEGMYWLCMAMWAYDDGEIAFAASDVFGCPIVTNTSLSFDDVQVRPVSIFCTNEAIVLSRIYDVSVNQ